MDFCGFQHEILVLFRMGNLLTCTCFVYLVWFGPNKVNNFLKAIFLVIIIYIYFLWSFIWIQTLIPTINSWFVLGEKNKTPFTYFFVALFERPKGRTSKIRRCDGKVDTMIEQIEKSSFSWGRDKIGRYWNLKYLALIRVLGCWEGLWGPDADRYQPLIDINRYR